MEENTTPETDETVEEEVPPPEQDDKRESSFTDEADDATFPKIYVEKLRAENAKYRERSKSAEVTAQRLHTELVRATGKLADPSDLPFDADHLDDPEALASALDDLLAAKPHLASRRPVGDVGQGHRGTAVEGGGLLSILKSLT